MLHCSKERILADAQGDRFDKQAINAVARDCGNLAVECSDVSGYVAGAAHRIAGSLGDLDRLETVTADLLRDQALVARSTIEARTLAEEARNVLVEGHAVIEEAIGGYSTLTELILKLGERMAGFAGAMQQVRQVSSEVAAIARKTDMLAINATIEAARAGDEGRGFVVVAKEVKRLAEETRTATGQIAEVIGSLTAEADLVAAEIRMGVTQSRAARRGFAQITGTVEKVTQLVTQVDGRTEEIAQSAHHIQHSVESVMIALEAFAADARANGAQLNEARQRLSALETMSGTMLDRLAHSGVRIDDSHFVELAERTNRDLEQLIETAIARGEINEAEVFDTLYQPISGTHPPQYWNHFCEFADGHVRPVLDRVTDGDPRHVGCVLSDVNGYLPTHISRRSEPQGSDPAWNNEHCRNRCNFIDDALRRAIASERTMLVTYRLDLGGDRYLPVKNVFVPTWICGRRWGNFELAYRD